MIYFIQNECPNRYIKIGYTGGAVADRLSSIQTGNPYPVTLLGTMEGDQTKEYEIQVDFEHLHVRGEWYKPAPELLKFIETFGGRKAAIVQLLAEGRKIEPQQWCYSPEYRANCTARQWNQECRDARCQ